MVSLAALMSLCQAAANTAGYAKQAALYDKTLVNGFEDFFFCKSDSEIDFLEIQVLVALVKRAT